jgi:cystathionine beta-lyase/cystathionine gamma-synthase
MTKGKPKSYTHRATVPPLYQSAVFDFERVEELAAQIKSGPEFPPSVDDLTYIYARGGNPTQRKLELDLAALEQADDALTFASGMAAITAVALTFGEAGCEIVVGYPVYGDTYAVFADLLPRFGVNASFVDASDAGEVRRALARSPRMLFCETPANPSLAVTDLKAVSRACKKRDCLLVVDNTFATPVNQNPLALGADLVVHSLTKFIGGHSDLVGGAVAGAKELITRIRMTQFITGAILDPFAAWLVLRSLKTLQLRVQRQNENALALARMLEKSAKVARVYYPGLASSPHHRIAKKQMRGFGGIVSFELNGGLRKAKKFANRVPGARIAVSLGSTETLIQIPALITHRIVPEGVQESLGIPRDLVRVAVGIEPTGELVANFKQALKEL